MTDWVPINPQVPVGSGHRAVAVGASDVVWSTSSTSRCDQCTLGRNRWQLQKSWGMGLKVVGGEIHMNKYIKCCQIGSFDMF